MIDFTNVEKYKENNRIEAKKALGGLPHSIWETYSAFANTLGGIILLGVEEHSDKSLHPVDLPDPERLIKEFWDIVNNTRKVSANILSDKDVSVESVDGKRIVAIRVPRAQRSDKPVYIDGDPLGSYRRSGEGDYKCTKEDVQAMMRDAAIKTQDMLVLENVGLDAFDYDSVKRYRIRMKACRPEHAWERLEDEEFLYKLGALGKACDGTMRPTAAGLLMFGREYEIVKEFPEYFLDYQEQLGNDILQISRIVSSSGDWSGNIFDFYFRVYEKLTQNIKITPSFEKNSQIDDTPVRKALKEALANCLVNADYYGKQGIVIIKKNDLITFSNPGAFRIDTEAAKIGGVSDPRNSSLIKMFNLIDVGKRSGSGIPNIFSVWKKQGWAVPVINESFNPDRITLSLPIGKSNDNKTAVKSNDKTTKTKSQIQKQAVIAYLTEKIAAKNAEIAVLIGVKDARARRLLAEMVAEGTVMAVGGNKNKVYKLKS